jgi:HK97 family phage major capsid protein
VSPRVKPKPKLPEWRPEVKNPWLAEFRSEAAKGERPRAFSDDAAFWKYLLTPAVPGPLGGADYGLDREEHRVLSKASSAAGGYLVPTSFDEQITAARRARAVIGAVSRELVTGDGTQMLFPSTTAHGVATWTAENVAYTASDEVFGQVTVGAFKGATKVIVSEELAERPSSCVTFARRPSAAGPIRLRSGAWR